MIRFTPRKPRSTWSAVNIARAGELRAQGRMQPSGLAAFEARTDDTSAIYAYEQRHAARLELEQEREFRANEQAWAYFQSRPPSYRQDRDLVGREREARGDEGEASPHAHRRLRTGPDDPPADATLEPLSE